MFNEFDFDNGYTKSFKVLSKESIGTWSHLCGETSGGLPGQGTSGGGGGLPATGPLSLEDIQNVLGGSNPISLSEYYGSASGVPASGTINVSDFRGVAPFPLNDLALFIDPGNSNCYSGSGTTVNDLSNTQTSSLTLSNVTYSSSNGGIFQFPGGTTDNRITLPSQPVGIDKVVKNYTIHFFIRPGTPNTAQNASAIFGQSNTGSNRYTWPLYVELRTAYSTPRIQFYTTASGAVYQVQNLMFSQGIANNTWHHVAITTVSRNCDFHDVSYYINGQNVQTSSLTYPQTSAPSGITYTIGASTVDGNLYNFRGDIGVVMFYSWLQNATQIQQVYDSFKGRYGLT